MSSAGAPVEGRAAELRREFDASFAAVPEERQGTTEDFLALAAGGSPYAVRLSESSGLHAGCAVTALPGAVPGLRGIAAVGGLILPVYDLGALLGARPAERPRWMLVAAGSVVAFAFDGFEGLVRVSREAVAGEQCEGGRRTHSHEVLRTEGGLRPILHLPSLIREIEVGARQGAPGKGR